MPSGCPECRELADSCVMICRELEWLISRQKLDLMRHNFRTLSSFEPDIERLNRKRMDIVSEIFRHLETHFQSGP
jgi:hypothetical protein